MSEPESIPIIESEPTPSVSVTPSPSCTPQPSPTPPPTPQPSTMFIIADASGVKFMDIKDPIENVIGAVYLYQGNDQWGRGFERSHKFVDSNVVVTEAKRLTLESLVKVYVVQMNGNQVGIGEIQYT